MKKKLLIVLTLIFLFPFVIKAEELKMDFQKNYGGNKDDQFLSIALTGDGGFVNVGYSLSSDIEGITNKGSNDAIIVKYDKNGEILWQKNYGGTYSDYFKSAAVTKDEGFIVVGYSDSKDIEGITRKGSNDAIIVKYDKDGNVVWQKNYGGSSDDYFNSVVVTKDEGFIAACYSLSSDIEGITNKGSHDAIIVKYDKDGNVVWQKNYGGNEDDEFLSIALTGDGGFVSVGYSLSSDIEGITNNGIRDAIIVKYDKDGNMLWQKNYGGWLNDYFNSVVVTKDEGFIAVGNFSSTDIEGITNKGSDDAIIVKYDKDGNMLWQKNYGGNNNDYFRSVALTKDEGFIAVGYSSSSNIEGITNKGSNDAIIVKYDKDGNLLWQKSWGGSSYDGVKSVSITSDEEYIVVGFVNSSDIEDITNKGNTDSFVLKYSFEYNLDVTVQENGTSTVEQQGKHGIITALPNEGYKVGTIIIKDKNGEVLDLEITKQEDGTYSFELYTDVTVEVSFVRNFKISKVYTKNGEVEVDKIDDNHGIVSFTPHSGFEFDKVIVKNSKGELVDVIKQDDESYLFELNDDVSVEVVFKRELVNPKTGVTNSVLALFIGFIISFTGFLIVKKYNERYEI